MTAALHRLRSALARDEGVALVFAVGASAVLAATTTATIAYTSSNYRTTARSKADQLALALAEAGLNNAYATLYASGDPSMPGAVGTRTAEMEGGTASWYGELASGVWTLNGVGTVRNPSGGDAVVRRVSARVRLGSSTRGSANNAVWNYVYTDELTGCTSLTNSVNVNVPLYVRGNLCMSNTAKVTGYALQVGGTVSFTNSASVGTATAPITEAHIGGGCIVEGAPPVACGPATRVHASVVDDRPTNLTKPPVDLEYWYANAKPGPRYGCTSGSFPGGFDNDSLMNRSRGEVDLTPTEPYDCQVRDQAGTLVGRIAWSGGARGTLTVLGTIFFDGNVVMQNLVEAVYQGRATIYSSGSITIKNNSKLCGVAGCGTDWKPAENLLAFIAGAPRGSTGMLVDNFSTFQGASYAVGDFREGNNATVWGPIVANQVHLQNSTSNFYVPIGTLLPGMPATYEEATSLTNEPGSWGS